MWFYYSTDLADLYGRFTVLMFILDSSLDDLCGGTVDDIHTVGTAILFVVQEPARVGQTSDLDIRVTQLLQELRNRVHIQQHPGAARTTRNMDV